MSVFSGGAAQAAAAAAALAYAALILGVGARRHRRRAVASRASGAPEHHETLCEKYAKMRRRSADAADSWPHAEKMRAHCSPHPLTGALSPPDFRQDGQGPLGAYSMLASAAALRLGHSSAAQLCVLEQNMQTLRWCRSAFRSFVAELEAVFDDAQRCRFRNLVLFATEASWHTCVAVYQEHPSLLPEAERANWRHVDAQTAAALASSLAAAASQLHAPTLSLDSLVVCSDGALIAGFVEAMPGLGRFGVLREAARAAGQGVLGDAMTSRPKQLIHVTLGRVLGLPALSHAQREHVAALVRRFNQAVPPRMGAQKLTVTSVSLVRDTVWWMTEYEELHSSPLALT